MALGAACRLMEAGDFHPPTAFEAESSGADREPMGYNFLVNKGRIANDVAGDLAAAQAMPLEVTSIEAGRNVLMNPLNARRRTPVDPRRGAILVELAIILPLLLLFAGGIVDFSRFAQFYVAVSDAAGNGARFASFHPYTEATSAVWSTKTRAAVTASMDGVPGFRSDRLTIEGPTVVQGLDGGQVKNARLTVSYRFSPIVQWPGIPRETTVRRTVEMKLVR